MSAAQRLIAAPLPWDDSGPDPTAGISVTTSRSNPHIYYLHTKSLGKWYRRMVMAVRMPYLEPKPVSIPGTWCMKEN